MNEPISGALDRLTTGGGRAIMVLQAQARALWLRAMVLRRRWLLRVTPDRDGVAGATNEPVSGALVKLTSESRKVILALPGHGRALVKRVPQPVQIELRKLSSRGAHVCREIFAGILVVGLVAIVLGYGRLGRGPISLQSLVPSIEAAINGELSDVRVKIDDAILQRAPDGPGVLFRLRNIRLVDKDGSILAQAPLRCHRHERQRASVGPHRARAASISSVRGFSCSTTTPKAYRLSSRGLPWPRARRPFAARCPPMATPTRPRRQSLPRPRSPNGGWSRCPADRCLT